MSRAVDLARAAIARHQRRHEPWEQSIAWAIREALAEQAAPEQRAPLPRACAAVVALLEAHGESSPLQLARRRGTSVEASRQVLYRLAAAGVVAQPKHGRYALAPSWQVAAAHLVDRIAESASRGGRTAALALHARRRTA